MESTLKKYLVAGLLFTVSTLAFAQYPIINILTAKGVPGTGGNVTVYGPCYCNQTALLSPVFLLNPGTYDFGKVKEYWVQSGETPDGGPNQPNLYVLFDPLEMSGAYAIPPYDFPSQPGYSYPTVASCNQDDAACNASFGNLSKETDLIFTVSPGENAIQIGLIGRYVYISPLPEPFTFAMFALGLSLMVGISRRRISP